MKLLIILLTVWMGIASAAEPQRNLTVDSSGTTEKRVALVIGNAAYKSGPLVNPVNDARAMAKRLRSLGFDVVLRENLKQREIGGVYREFRSKITPGGVALVFYAGHGVQFKGQNYFPATDADISSEEDVPLQSLNLGNLLDNMEEAKAGVSLVFLDACRDNPFTRRFRSSTRGLVKVEAASGMLIHYATRPGSVASDGDGRNGTYTEALLDQMSQPGVPVEQMLKRVSNQVVAKTKGKQEPWVEGSLRGDFYFIFLGPTTVQMQAQPADPEAETWTAAQGANTVAGYQTYLDAYPKGRYAHAAKINLTDLQKSATSRPEKTSVVISPTTAQVAGTISVDTSERDKAMTDYLGRIRAKIRGNIVMPPEIKGNPEAVFNVTQLPSGEILAVRLKRTSGYPALDAAIERAILNSNPLPQPERHDLFSRALELHFRPLDGANEKVEAVGLEQWIIQLGNYKETANVKLLVAKLHSIAIPSFVEPNTAIDGPRTRVRAGPFGSRAAADSALTRIRSLGISGPIVVKATP